MADIIKAIALCVGLYVFCSILGITSKGRPGNAASTTPSRVVTDGRLAGRPLPVTRTVTRGGTYAQVCASFDPVAHPEQVIDILEYAHSVTGTPVDILYSVWRKETGHFDGAGTGSGTCDVIRELKIRDGAKGTRHLAAMEVMAAKFRWDLPNMTCSCAGKDDETGERVGYGGCCGPFQFSGAEIDDEYALPLNLDPMRFCDGALIAGWELKKHHDSKLRDGKARRIMKSGRYDTLDQGAWHAAMSRYYGADPRGKYGRTAIAKWKQFHEWHLVDKRQPGYLVAKILDLDKSRDSLRYHRKLRASRSQYASN